MQKSPWQLEVCPCSRETGKFLYIYPSPSLPMSSGKRKGDQLILTSQSHYLEHPEITRVRDIQDIITQVNAEALGLMFLLRVLSNSVDETKDTGRYFSAIITQTLKY